MAATTKLVDSDYNLFWHCGKPMPGLDQLRRSGLDTHSAVADPRFVDPAKDNYALRPDSPAFRLGFKSIDTTSVGLRRDRQNANAGSAKED